MPRRPFDDVDLACKIRLLFGEHLQHVAVHRTGLDQAGADRTDDVAVPVREEGPAEEPVGRLLTFARQEGGGRQPARVAVGIGERMHVTLEVAPACRAPLAPRDQIRLVERRTPP